MIHRIFFRLLSIIALPLAAHAAGQNPAEAKLRENLRSVMIQLRTLQGERDTLQAAKTQLEAEKKTAADQATALQQQLAADKEAADKTIAELRAQTAAQGDQLLQTKESLEKWKASHAEVTALAQKKEAERARLSLEKTELQRIVADQRTKNLGMYRVGTEILSRYEHFGLGTAITAREPFTGVMRVKLENLAQDLGDQLAAQRIKAEPAARPEPAASAAEKPASPKPGTPRALPAKPVKPKPSEPGRRSWNTGFQPVRPTILVADCLAPSGEEALSGEPAPGPRETFQRAGCPLAARPGWPCSDCIVPAEARQKAALGLMKTPAPVSREALWSAVRTRTASNTLGSQ